MAPCKIIKITGCQIILALVLFTASVIASQASPIPPAPVCHVTGKIISQNASDLKLKVTSEKQIAKGYDQNSKCEYKKEKIVTVQIRGTNPVIPKNGSIVSADLQYMGDENGLWVNGTNLTLQTK